MGPYRATAVPGVRCTNMDDFMCFPCLQRGVETTAATVMHGFALCRAHADKVIKLPDPELLRAEDFSAVLNRMRRDIGTPGIPA